MAKQTSLPLYPGEPMHARYPRTNHVCIIFGALVISAAFLAVVTFVKSSTLLLGTILLLYGILTVFVVVTYVMMDALDRALYSYRWLRAFQRNNADLGITGRDIRRIRRAMVNPPGHICRYATIQSTATALAHTLRHKDYSPDSAFAQAVLNQWVALETHRALHRNP